MNNRALIEAALFVSEKPLNSKKLSDITGLNEKEINLINLFFNVSY